MNYINLQKEPIKIDDLYQRVVASCCGAVASFIGITRDNFEGRRVARLSYEAYESMAIKELNRLCDETRKQYVDVHHIAISHRLGDVPISDISVAIFVSGSHRRDALDAVSFLIERLKANIPIWKMEFYDDNSAYHDDINNGEDEKKNEGNLSYCWKENQ